MTRVHTWMKNFGHRLPKPSVLMSTVVQKHLQPLEGKWSKKMERAWQRLQTKILMGITPIRNLLLNKHWFLVCVQYYFSFTKKRTVFFQVTLQFFNALPLNHLRRCRTALRFREAWKHQEHRKIFYTKTLSKSKKRIRVTGGKDLAESGVYTPQFCKAVISCWHAACRGEDVSFTSSPADYRAVWNHCFKYSSTRKDP